MEQQARSRSRPSSLITIFIVTIVCICVGSLLIVVTSQTTDRSGFELASILPTSIPDNTSSGNLAPDFSASSVSGSTVHLSQYQGQVVIVDFWTTWCPSCVEGMPVLQDAHDRYSGQDVVVLAVNIGESRSEVSQFMDEHNLDLTVLLDSTEEIAIAYNIRSIPTLFIINPAGEIDAVHYGSASASQLDHYIDEAKAAQ